MPRNDSTKMSANYNNTGGGGSSNADRIQPGRIMLLLRDALVDDELVYQIALQAGDVKAVHRPQANRQLVFVQYEDPSVAEHAIAMMRKLPIFKGVDPAIKSEKFVADKGNTNNSSFNDDQQQRGSNMAAGEFRFSCTQQNMCLLGGGAAAPAVLLQHNQAIHFGGGRAFQLYAVQQQRALLINTNATIIASFGSFFHGWHPSLLPPSPPLNPELVRLLDTVKPIASFPGVFQDPSVIRRPVSMNNQFNKSGGNRQQKGGNNANYRNNNNNNKNNNNSMNGGGGFGTGLNNYRQQQGGRNDDYGDVNLMTMDFESPTMAQTRSSQETYQPKFSLGCWYCTKMPSYECRCGAFYCDFDCQRADWPVHKDYCLPRLVPISYSNKRILQEASSSMHSSNGGSYSSFSPFSGDSQPQQQQNQQQKQHKQQQSNQQSNQNNRRGQTNAKGNQATTPNQSNANQNQKKDSPRASIVPQSPADNQRTTPKSSPEENDSDKVSRMGNKLQRLKIAKLGSGAVTRGVLQAGPFPREGATVKITASLASGVIYIYHNNGKDGQQSDYYLLTNRMYKAAGEANSLKEAPVVDDVIFAPYIDGFFRAKVLSVSGDKLQVFFVDFGNTETVEWKQSREIADEDLKWAKYLTYPAKLEGVETFSVQMLKFLESLEHNEDFEMVKADSMKDSEIKMVVLKKLKQSLTLNMELMELKEREIRERNERERVEKESKNKKEQPVPTGKVNVQIADPSNYQPVLFDETMDAKQLPLGVTKKLIIIDASEVKETRIISVVAADNVEKYAEVLEHCGLAGAKDSNVYKPTQEGEVCLVLHQEDWSRALFDISDGSFMLLDVGIIAPVPPSNVRRYPPQLSHVVYNNEVLVENLPKLLVMMNDGKPETLNGKLIDAKIAAVDDGIGITIVEA